MKLIAESLIIVGILIQLWIEEGWRFAVGDLKLYLSERKLYGNPFDNCF